MGSFCNSTACVDCVCMSSAAYGRKGSTCSPAGSLGGICHKLAATSRLFELPPFRRPSGANEGPFICVPALLRPLGCRALSGLLLRQGALSLPRG